MQCKSDNELCWPTLNSPQGATHQDDTHLPFSAAILENGQSEIALLFSALDGWLGGWMDGGRGGWRKAGITASF